MFVSLIVVIVLLRLRIYRRGGVRYLMIRADFAVTKRDEGPLAVWHNFRRTQRFYVSHNVYIRFCWIYGLFEIRQ